MDDTLIGGSCVGCIFLRNENGLGSRCVFCAGWRICNWNETGVGATGSAMKQNQIRLRDE